MVVFEDNLNMYAKQSLANLAGVSPARGDTRKGHGSEACGGYSDMTVGVRWNKYAGRNAKA